MCQPYGRGIPRATSFPLGSGPHDYNPVRAERGEYGSHTHPAETRLLNFCPAMLLSFLCCGEDGSSSLVIGSTSDVFCRLLWPNNSLIIFSPEGRTVPGAVWINHVLFKTCLFVLEQFLLSSKLHGLEAGMVSLWRVVLGQRALQQ